MNVALDDRLGQPPLDTADWSPRVRAFYDYWLRIHPPGRLPGRQHFDPCDIPKLLAGIWLIDVQRVPLRLRYRLIGTDIVKALGREMTGEWLDDAHPHIKHHPSFLTIYHHIVFDAAVYWMRGQPVLKHLEKFSSLENVRVPLATDGRTVDMVASYSELHYSDRPAF